MWQPQVTHILADMRWDHKSGSRTRVPGSCSCFSCLQGLGRKFLWQVGLQSKMNQELGGRLGLHFPVVTLITQGKKTSVPLTTTVTAFFLVPTLYRSLCHFTQYL
jgi:hypothetical protein